MQNSSISSSRTQHYSGDRWWDSALCGSLRVDESFKVELLSTSSCSNHGYNPWNNGKEVPDGGLLRYRK